jgi:3-methyladenine DNA glycosylase AlkD
MHKEHKKILNEIKKNEGNGTQQSSNDRYILSGHVYFDVSVPIRRRIAKEWLRQNKDIPDSDFVALLDSLYRGTSHEEKTLASYLLSYHHTHRKKIQPKHLDEWLDHLVGWAEVDALCQNVFTADELLSDWKRWGSFLKKLSRDTNINKRRASLVLLTGPTARSDDARLRKLAFELIEVLKHERPIIITKAISWLLRSMTAKHNTEVAEYVKKHADTLPKIAVRETVQKLKTGKK